MTDPLSAMAAISVTGGVILGGVVYGWRAVSRKLNGGDPVVAKLAEVVTSNRAIVTAINSQNELAASRHDATINAHGKTATAIAGLRGFVEGARK